MAPDTLSVPLLPDLVRLGATPAGKEEAIREAAQLLVAAGCIDPAYVDSMIRREGVANTFLGHGVAIPHGMVEDRELVRRNGIAILQIPQGVRWNEEQTARLVVAIAARSDAHITVLRRLTRLMQDEERLNALFIATDPALLLGAMSEETAAPAPAGPAADLAERFEWTVDYPTGLHARPASAWVEAARAAPGRVQIRHGDQVADAKTLVALLQLGLRMGDRVVVSADGAEAATTVARMKGVITRLTAKEQADAAAAERKARVPVQGWIPPTALPAIAGVGASPGLAIGPVHVVLTAPPAVPDRPESLIDGGNRLHEALDRTRQQLKALADDTARRLGPAEAGIFTAQAELLNDTDLITRTCQLMVEGHGPGWSWHEAVESGAAALAALPNPVLAARAADLRDVGRRVLARIDPSLRGGTLHDLPDTPCILIADDLSPSDTAGLDMARVIGLATAQGGPTSHTAILARTLGLPAMVAGGAALTGLANGTPAILDGQSGRLFLNPTEADLAAAHGWIEEQRVRKALQEERRGLPARTRDGHAVEIGANVNRPDQVPVALSQGAEAVGLMRTEFLFLERGDAPSEDEQFETYRAMLAALDGRPLIVRALDIGGDKQVPHLHLPHEENPFLGVRGARLLLRQPELLEPQLRALYRAAREAKPGALSIMFPMITTLAEIQALRAACDRIRAELDAPAVPLGIMVEVPAAAVMADALARHVDFFSIGTNDLTQYALAVDRQHPELAAEADSLHPAVLRLIRMTVEGADRHGRWVGVCGGIAGDPFGAALLAGLGVRELSMTPRDIPGVKDRLRDSSLTALRDLARRALDCETADAVRALDAGTPDAGTAGAEAAS
ncbi:phosphoenolpyruvate--protein phosphotransferase [Azospirillum agricola]|uniref:phosphoenolpyruvate--protein phosphotransferase n=1 Tax=Azospirillum agricola TaxID=1720247 RepID=UPI000A0F218D|nr:phosphoenolpyruvate--protein phosphotransferase [Azospirillum agricola]SMH62732.1 phosphocarrier protein FPr [Azospirillum lipoferum]